MKVGTDGVLVGAWAHGGRRVLDIGTGSGLIALMMAQRFPAAQVEGVELDAAAAAQARDNVTVSPFASRVAVFHTPFQQFMPSAFYDAIVSNPPFFLSGPTGNDLPRTAARHAQTAFFHDFFAFARCWLTPEGEVSLIVPWDAAEAVAAEAYLRGLFLTRRVSVRTKTGKPLERALLAFGRRRQGWPEMGEVCLLDDSGRRGPWYRQLTAAFYLDE